MADDGFPIAVPLELTRQGATPTAPPAGTVSVYVKTDDLLYKQTSAGVESAVGGSGTPAGREFFLS